MCFWSAGIWLLAVLAGMIISKHWGFYYDQHGRWLGTKIPKRVQEIQYQRESMLEIISSPTCLALSSVAWKCTVYLESPRTYAFNPPAPPQLLNDLLNIPAAPPRHRLCMCNAEAVRHALIVNLHLRPPRLSTTPAPEDLLARLIRHPVVPLAEQKKQHRPRDARRRRMGRAPDLCVPGVARDGVHLVGGHDHGGADGARAGEERGGDGGGARGKAVRVHRRESGRRAATARARRAMRPGKLRVLESGVKRRPRAERAMSMTVGKRQMPETMRGSRCGLEVVVVVGWEERRRRWRWMSSMIM